MFLLLGDDPNNDGVAMYSMCTRRVMWRLSNAITYLTLYPHNHETALTVRWSFYRYTVFMNSHQTKPAFSSLL